MLAASHWCCAAGEAGASVNFGRMVLFVNKEISAAGSECSIECGRRNGA